MPSDGTPLTVIQKMDAKTAAGQKIQERINVAYFEIVGRCIAVGDDKITRIRHLRDHLISIAESRLAEFPQYGGDYFDNFVAAIIPRKIQTRGGLQTLQGDVVLAVFNLQTEEEPSRWVIFSNRTFQFSSIGSIEPQIL